MFLSLLVCLCPVGTTGFAIQPVTERLQVNVPSGTNHSDTATLLQHTPRKTPVIPSSSHSVNLAAQGLQEQIGSRWKAWTVGVVMLLVLAALITDLVPPSIVMLVALCFTWALNILTDRQALQGFSNSSLVVVGSMFLVIKGVDRSKVIDRTARMTLGAKTSEFWALVRLCLITTFFGCFINNAPLVGLFMPIVRDWARAREFAPSKFLMPLSFASIGGGTLTLIGTSTNLVINGMMVEETGEVFHFFDPAFVGIFQNLFSLLYLLTLGRRLLPEAKGGLFRTLRERKEDMVTELQVEPNFPLVGESVVEVAEALGIPREAVLKIFRRPLRKTLASQLGVPIKPLLTPGAGRSRLKRASTEESEKKGAPESDWPDLLSSKSSPYIETGSGRNSSTYMARTAHCWGKNRDGRSRAMTDTPATGLAAPMGARARPRTLSSSEVEKVDTEAESIPKVDPDDPDVYEIFPVPDHETILAGDVLLLSLPRDACVDFVDSTHVAKLLSTESASEAKAEDRVGLRLCNMDLLEIPGRQGEYAELVISESNPFVGMDFFASASARRQFEEHYQVAVLAVRQKSWGVAEESTKTDVLLSYTHTHQHQRLKRMTSTGSVESIDEAVDFGFGHSPTEASESPVTQASAVCAGGAFSFAGTPASTPGFGNPDPDPMTNTRHGAQKLRQGDAVLVLAKAGTAVGQQFPAQDFLAQTTVAHEPAEKPSASDYVPLVLFAVGIVLVAVQKASMVQVSMVLAAVYLLLGWVTIQELREDIDWNMLVLIGSALGLAKAVQASGLSGAIATEVKRAQFGERGTVFLLFTVTMLITELVTNNAAAAVCFPLAADLSRQMGLKSVKPLAMTVMLATSACYMNPIGAAQHLIIMGPGGYTFKDFVKVGIMMDLICLATAGILVPMFWPMEQFQLPIV